MACRFRSSCRLASCWRLSIPSRWSRGRPRPRPSSRPCSPMACGPWCRPISTRGRAWWYRPKTALISNAPRSRMCARRAHELLVGVTIVHARDVRMNYRHAYHARNFADVLKHAALVSVLLHLRKKDTPFAVIDTHGGRGLYDLGGAEAQKTAESANGILRLLQQDAPPGVLAPYCDL